MHYHLIAGTETRLGSQNVTRDNFTVPSVKLHQEIARAATPDDDLPICTEEERWVKGHEWAIKRVNRKTAMKVFRQDKGESEADAAAWIASKANTEGYSIDWRPGESTRCQQRFCLAWQVCPLGQSYRQPQENDL